jgi:hypothetical protein
VREGRASVRASFRGPLLVREVVLLVREVVLGLAAGLLADLEPLVWPFRLPHAGVDDFVVRAPETPFAGREVAPLMREPLLVPLVCFPFACAPFSLPLAVAGGFGLQRVPLAGLEPFLAAGRAAESVPARRTGRVAARLPVEDCAGLRSRECTAGRLKWGRAAGDLVSEADLRAAGVRGAWVSGDLRGSNGAGADVET